MRASSIKARHELVEAFIEAAGTHGLPRVQDFNTGDHEGVGYYQLTTRNGLRCSSAVAYLKRARRRPNLTVMTGTQAARILFDGKRACGVRAGQPGALRTLRARCEVLLAAGALQSPQLLQLSGIGPEALLTEHGIKIVHASPGVGENLQDHLQIRLMYEVTKPITSNDDLRIRPACGGLLRHADSGIGQHQRAHHHGGGEGLGSDTGGCPPLTRHRPYLIAGTSQINQ